ncbi:MAG: tautomerase family protein [Actinobacteria bacterium]|nr:tautomerase family protein [Actinomycetota bacterium]
MPHVIIKLWPGRTEDQKIRLCKEIARSLIEIINVPENSISIAIEEVPSEKWAEEVYKPDIIDKKDNLYIKPGGNSFK